MLLSHEDYIASFFLDMKLFQFLELDSIYKRCSVTRNTGKFKLRKVDQLHQTELFNPYFPLGQNAGWDRVSQKK